MKTKTLANGNEVTNGNKGFTIVELVIVIAVIGILAAVLIPTFNSIINKADASKATQEVTNAMKELNLIHPNLDLDSLLVLYYEQTDDEIPDIGYNSELKYMFEFINRKMLQKEYDTFNIDGNKLTIDGKLYYYLDIGKINENYPNISIYSRSKDIETKPNENKKYTVTIDKSSDAITNMDFSKYEKEWESGSVIPLEFDSNETKLLKIFINDLEVGLVELGSVNPVYYLTITDTDVIVRTEFCYIVSFTEEAKEYFDITKVNEIESTKYLDNEEVSIICKSSVIDDLNINETIYIKANNEVVMEIYKDENGATVYPLILLTIDNSNITISVEKIKDTNVICYEDLYPFVNDFKSNDVSNIKEIIEIKGINYQNAYEYFSACYMDKSTVSGQLYIIDFIKHLKLSKFEKSDAPIQDVVTDHRKYVIVTDTEVYELMYTDRAIYFNNEYYELKQTDRFGEMDHYYSYCVFNNINLNESSFYTVNIMNKTSNVEIIDTLDLRRLIFTQNEDLVVYNPVTNITFKFNGFTYRILNNKQFRNEDTNQVYDIVNNFSFENILSKVRPTYVTLSEKYDFINNINKEDVKEIMYHKCSEELINKCEYITIDSEEKNLYLDLFINYLKTNKFEYVENPEALEPTIPSYYSLIINNETVYQIESSDYIYINGDCYKTKTSIPELPDELKQEGYTFAKGDYENYNANFQTDSQIQDVVQDITIDVRSIIFEEVDQILTSEVHNTKFVYDDIDLYFVSLGENNTNILLKMVVNEKEYYLEILNSFDATSYVYPGEKCLVWYEFYIIDINAILLKQVYYEYGYHLTKEDIIKDSHLSNFTYTIYDKNENVLLHNNDIYHGYPEYLILDQDVKVKVNEKLNVNGYYEVTRCLSVSGLEQGNIPNDMVEPVPIVNVPSFLSNSASNKAMKLIYTYKDVKEEFDYVTQTTHLSKDFFPKTLFESNIVLCYASRTTSMYLQYYNFNFTSNELSINTKSQVQSEDNREVTIVDFIIIPKQEVMKYSLPLELEIELTEAIEYEYGHIVKQVKVYYEISGNYIIYPVFNDLNSIRKDVYTKEILGTKFICDYDILVYSESKGLRTLDEARYEGINGLTKSIEYIATIHYAYNPNFRRILEDL